MEESSGRPPMGGVARRRRERRLRSMLRHEQQSIRMALATVMHHSFKVHTEYGGPRSQTSATRAGEGEVREQHYGLRAQDRPLLGTRPAPLLEVLPQVGHSGTLWTTLSTPFMGYRRSMVLCRLWWNSWWTCSSSLTRSFLLPSRLSTCPRSSSSASRLEPRFASRSWWNSWWKYRRSCHFPRCSGLWNRPWTFSVPQGGGRHADLQSFLRGQSSTGVEVLKVLALDRVRQRLRLFSLQVVRMRTRISLVKGFSHFSSS